MDGDVHDEVVDGSKRGDPPKVNVAASTMAKTTVYTVVWVRTDPGIPKWRCGTWVIRVSIASIRDAAKTLAMTPDAVATTARTTVNQTPACPNAGRAASASEKSSALRISETVRLPATVAAMAR